MGLYNKTNFSVRAIHDERTLFLGRAILGYCKPLVNQDQHPLTNSYALSPGVPSGSSKGCS